MDELKLLIAIYQPAIIKKPAWNRTKIQIFPYTISSNLTFLQDDTRMVAYY